MTSLLDTDRAHLFQVGDARQDFLDAVHLQCTHALVERRGEQLSDTRPLLDLLLDQIGAAQQLVQADTPPVATASTGITAARPIEYELAAPSVPAIPDVRAR